MMRQQLKRVEQIIQGRRRNARELLEVLNPLEGIHAPADSGRNIWTKCTVALDTADSMQRFYYKLKRIGIELEPMYRPLHLTDEGEPFAEGSYPASEDFFTRVINLPVRPNLTDKQRQYLARSLQKMPWMMNS